MSRTAWGRDAWTAVVTGRGGAKYRNVPTVTPDGERADSRKEAAVLQEYRRLEQAGAVQDVKPQYTFPLHVNGRHICDYRADVVFTRHGVQYVVDVKSPPTRAKPDYRIKVKLLKALYGLDVLER